MSEEENSAERIWVGVRQGAEITGQPVGYFRHLATSIWDMPLEERPLKVRLRSKRYEFWLPDLVRYLESPEVANAQKEPDVEPIWVMTREAAEITGYSYPYIQELVNKIRQLPENERPIRLRTRVSRFNELWLPDLIAYVENIGHGPHTKPRKKDA